MKMRYHSTTCLLTAILVSILSIKSHSFSRLDVSYDRSTKFTYRYLLPSIGALRNHDIVSAHVSSTYFPSSNRHRSRTKPLFYSTNGNPFASQRRTSTTEIFNQLAQVVVATTTSPLLLEIGKKTPILLLQSFVLNRLLPVITNLKNDQWYIWALISLSSTLGLLAEKTKFGSMLSSPLVTMGISLLFCNIGLLPAKSAVYDVIIKVLVPLAIPCLLLDADIRKCIKYTGTLLKAFIIGSIGTVLGTLVAYYFVPMKATVESPLIAAALCARHVRH